MHRDEEIRLSCSKLAAAIVIRCGARDGVCALGAGYDRELEKRRTNRISWIGGNKCTELALERGGNSLGKTSPECTALYVGLTVDVTSRMR